MFFSLDVALDRFLLELPSVRREDDSPTAPPLFSVSIQPKRFSHCYTLESYPPIYKTEETISFELQSRETGMLRYPVMITAESHSREAFETESPAKVAPEAIFSVMDFYQKKQVHFSASESLLTILQAVAPLAFRSAEPVPVQWKTAASAPQVKHERLQYDDLGFSKRL